jgi:hypothetical protein
MWVSCADIYDKHTVIKLKRLLDTRKYAWKNIDKMSGDR